LEAFDSLVLLPSLVVMMEGLAGLMKPVVGAELLVVAVVAVAVADLAALVDLVKWQVMLAVLVKLEGWLQLCATRVELELLEVDSVVLLVGWRSLVARTSLMMSQRLEHELLVISEMVRLIWLIPMHLATAQ